MTGDADAAAEPDPATLIGTTKLNGVDPLVSLADVLDWAVDLPQTQVHQLLPWHWAACQHQALAA